MHNWNDFFVATAGASAALTGFIFVSVSISLKQILAFPKLPNRTLESLLLPVNVLLISCCGLIPDQPIQYLGIESLMLGLLVAGSAFRLSLTMLKLTPAKYKRSYRLNILLSQLTVFPFWLAGILILVQGGDGVYWLVLGILLSFVKTVYDVWILVIEINR